MNNLWADLNKDIPKYFHHLAEKFSIQFVKISNLKTALISERYAIVVAIDRFDVDIQYIFRDEKGELVVLGCGNYFAERYDENDRTNLVNGNGAKEIIINNFIVIGNGLENKWEEVLRGDIGWINEYRKSKWYNEKNVFTLRKPLSNNIYKIFEIVLIPN